MLSICQWVGTQMQKEKENLKKKKALSSGPKFIVHLSKNVSECDLAIQTNKSLFRSSVLIEFIFIQPLKISTGTDYNQYRSLYLYP